MRNYFSYRWNLNQLEFKRLMKQGRTSLLIGGLFLSACLLISDWLGHNEHGPLLNVLRESLTIGGWVGMWRPLQIFLYDWWPLRATGEIYRRLSHSPVELRKPSAHISHPQVSRT